MSLFRTRKLPHVRFPHFLLSAFKCRAFMRKIRSFPKAALDA